MMLVKQPGDEENSEGRLVQDGPTTASKIDIDISKPINVLKDEIKTQKEARVKQALKDIDPYAVQCIFPNDKTILSSKLNNDTEMSENVAAIKIQSSFRGMKGRALYLEKLFQKFELEEQNRKYLTKYQVEEGELLIRERNAKQKIHDAKLINRNRRAVTEYNAILIQRCFKKWLKRKRMNRPTSINNKYTQNDDM
eukprot:g6170.t1